MPRRRIVIPGMVLSTDRRTTRRHFLFVPDASGETEEIFWYCLGISAQKFGIEVHAAVLMTNHVHLVITDVEGVAPDFFRELHRLLALCIKARLGWPEEVFNKSATGQNERVSTESILDGLAYVIANPCSAGLVRRASEWPGARTSAQDLGRRVIRAKRPKHFFRTENWPAVVELHITIPAALEAEMEPDEIRRRVAKRVRAHEAEALAMSKKTGRPFLGARRAQRVRHTDRASSWEDFGSRNPRLAASGDREAAQATIARNRQFDADYDRELAKWTAGDRNAVFPYGTWWMRVHHGVRVRPPP